MTFVDVTGPFVKIAEEEVMVGFVNHNVRLHGRVKVSQFCELALSRSSVRVVGGGAVNAGQVQGVF